MSPNHGNRFSGLPHVENQEDGVHDKLLRPLTYTTLDGWVITVPAGFVTDYASIPRPLWVVIPPRGKYNRGAIVHDLLYKYAPRDPRTGVACTQARADSILREACENCDDRFTQRWAIYLGLRLGGWWTWYKYRRAEGIKRESEAILSRATQANHRGDSPRSNAGVRGDQGPRHHLRQPRR